MEIQLFNAGVEILNIVYIYIFDYQMDIKAIYARGRIQKGNSNALK